MHTRLPPEYEDLAALVDAQPPKVRKAFQYCMAVLLAESGHRTQAAGATNAEKRRAPATYHR